MSEAPEKDSKTEDPSQRKLEEAHKKGDVAKSQEVTTWFMLLGTTIIASSLGPWMAVQVSEPLKLIMMNADRFDVDGAGFGAFFNGFAFSMIGAIIGPLGILYVCGVVANLVQHKPLMSAEPITPKLSKISPIAGAKRLFSVDALINFGKGLLKLSIVGIVVVSVVWPERDRLDTMMTADPIIILADVQEMAVKILTAVLLVVTLIAGADYFYTRQKWWKRQMMTVQETRDEYKQMEGDPHVKGRIRQLRQEKARKRMMAAVPDATVVLTNPTPLRSNTTRAWGRPGVSPRAQTPSPSAFALSPRRMTSRSSRTRLWRGRSLPPSRSIRIFQPITIRPSPRSSAL
jgi:flagellar biosynthetic protein FlhB